VVVLDPMGRFVRSWGEGLFGTPHGIRVDPEGNVWTVDAGTSVVHKFTSSGVLLQSARFEVPVFPRPFCGATDVAFGANGSVFLTDGYCNGRIVKLDSTGREVGEWGAWGSDRDNSSSRTASPSRPMGASSSPTETTHAFKSSIKTGAGWTRGNTLAWWPPSR
jgi:DNA-binding beta-propeller fold protein YncE